MTPREAIETYRRVAAILSHAGFRWIVEELEDAAAEGIPEEVVPDTSGNFAMRRVARIWPREMQDQIPTRRGTRNEKRLRYRKPTEVERLAALRDAIRTVFLDVHEMAGVITHELNVPAAQVAFRPDLAGVEAEFSRSSNVTFEATALVLTEQQRHVLSVLLKELEPTNASRG